MTEESAEALKQYFLGKVEISWRMPNTEDWLNAAEYTDDSIVIYLNGEYRIKPKPRKYKVGMVLRRLGSTEEVMIARINVNSHYLGNSNQDWDENELDRNWEIVED